MKTIIVASSIILLSGYAFAGQPHAEQIGERQWRQQESIHRGILNGQLTHKEAKKLIKEQHQIQQMKEQAWRDRRLSHKERHRIDQRLDKAGHHIARLKNNHHRRLWHYRQADYDGLRPFQAYWTAERNKYRSSVTSLSAGSSTHRHR